MRVVFMGTPDFAVPALEALIEAGHEIAGVFTQPDRSKTRSGKLRPTAVKDKAMEHQLKVFQPVRIREAEAVRQLASLKPEVIVVAAFGQLITPEILAIPKYGCLNIHASLLPAYRGAAPIQWAILNGEKETGVTIMQMDKGLDTGAMLLQEKVELTGSETGGELFERLSTLGGSLLLEALQRMEEGSLTPVPQPEKSTTPYARMIQKRDGAIHWEQPAEVIERSIRAFDPWPGTWTSYEGKKLKICRASLNPGRKNISVHPPASSAGTVLPFEGKSTELPVQTGRGVLYIQELQLEGKKRMQTADFLRGHSILPGTVLG